MGAGADTKQIDFTTTSSNVCPMTISCEAFHESLELWGPAPLPPISDCHSAGISSGDLNA